MIRSVKRWTRHGVIITLFCLIFVSSGCGGDDKNPVESNEPSQTGQTSALSLVSSGSSGESGKESISSGPTVSTPSSEATSVLSSSVESSALSQPGSESGGTEYSQKSSPAESEFSAPSTVFLSVESSDETGGSANTVATTAGSTSESSSPALTSAETIISSDVTAESSATIPPVTIFAITPNRGPSESYTPVTIDGDGFDENAVAEIGQVSAGKFQPLVSIKVIDSHTINAKIPGKLAGGYKDIKVTNPNTNASFVLYDAYTVTGKDCIFTKEGTLTKDETWIKGCTYKISGEVGVEKALITLETGTIVTMKSGSGLSIAQGAGLMANGDQNDPIIFQGENGGSWRGLSYLGGSVAESSMLNNVNIENAGSGGLAESASIFIENASPTITNSNIRRSKGMGMFIEGDASPTISNVNIEDTKGPGIYYNGSGSAFLIQNTTLRKCGGSEQLNIVTNAEYLGHFLDPLNENHYWDSPYAKILKGTISSDAAWYAIDNLTNLIVTETLVLDGKNTPHLHLGHLTEWSTLVINFPADTGIIVRQGLLTSEGLFPGGIRLDGPIDLNPMPGNWLGILFENSPAENSIVNTMIQAGGGSPNGAAIVTKNSQLSLQNSEILFNTMGIIASGPGSLTLSNSSLHDNIEGALQYAGTGQLTFEGNTIQNNGSEETHFVAMQAVPDAIPVIMNDSNSIVDDYNHQRNIGVMAGTMSQSQTWEQTKFGYALLGPLVIDGDALPALTLHNAMIFLGQNSQIQVKRGALLADSSKFSGFADVPPAWENIYFAPQSANRSHLMHSNIGFGGAGQYNALIVVENSLPEIKNNVIHDSNGAGILLMNSSLSPDSLRSGNTFKNVGQDIVIK
jgi:hypothetical protein